MNVEELSYIFKFFVFVNIVQHKLAYLNFIKWPTCLSSLVMKKNCHGTWDWLEVKMKGNRVVSLEFPNAKETFQVPR